MSHGTGLQNADDMQAALIAAAYEADPEVQLQMALQASITDFTRVDYDDRNLPKFARVFHEKAERFRKLVQPLPGKCEFAVARGDLFKTSFFEISRRKPRELCKKLVVEFAGEGRRGGCHVLVCF